MSLTSGARIGPYDIRDKLGEGGMGEVYRAHDAKLGRDVALKILPELFASDPERVARFEREARTLAALNQPHIAQIYGFEQSADGSALVMELVEGEDLAARLKRGALPLDEVLPITRQIAEALEAAHEAGIIHRDLKPANVKVRPDGTVKVLDFGLAKALDPAAASGVHAPPRVTQSPTITTPAMTLRGVILGTAAYMAPEQAKGRAVTKRADIWALGCVLFELLSGQRPFDGDDMTEVLAAVIKTDPDWSRLPPDVPPAIRTLIHGCLEKDPAKRVADAAVVRYALDHLGDPIPAPTVAPSPTLRRAMLAAAAVTIVVAAGLLGAPFIWRSPTPSPKRFAIVPPAGLPFAPQGTTRDISISPDGRYIVYRTAVDGIAKLAIRDVSQNEVRLLDGTDLARDPFMSPDGQWVAYFAGGFLKKGAVGGGAQITISTTSGAARGGSWVGDRIVYATSDPATGLMSVLAAGGEPTVLTRPDVEAGESDHLFPWITPDGAHVLYTAPTAGEGATALCALNLQTGERKVVVPGAGSGRYVGDGALLFATGGTLRAARFDPRRMALTSEPMPVLERLDTTDLGYASYAVSNDGLLVYTSGAAVTATRRTLMWVGQDGREEPLPVDGRSFADPRLSTDRRHAIVEINDGSDDVWTLDLQRGTVTRQTFEIGEDETPLWMPEGRTVAYTSTRSGLARAIHRRRADGAGDEERLWSGPEHVHLDAVTADGQSLIVSSATVNGAQMDLMVLPLDADRKLQPLLKSPFSEYGARLSPDGRLLAYVSEESGRPEVYVRSFPSLENKVQVSTHGGSQPNWERSGRELYFVSPEAMMAAPVQKGVPVTFGQARRLFEHRYYNKGGTHTSYDVAADGRFLMVREIPQPGETAGPQHLLVVVNWFEELAARLK